MEEKIILDAILVVDIFYNKWKKLIKVNAGTKIQIDMRKSIALINNKDHIDIKIEEYSIII